MEIGAPRSIRVAEGFPSRAIGVVPRHSQFKSTALNIRVGAEHDAHPIEIDMTHRECLPAFGPATPGPTLTVISILVGRLNG